MKKTFLVNKVVKPAFILSSISTAMSFPVTTFAEGFSLEEVVVTARKREESLQDTPISVTAFSADNLKDRQIDTSDQLTQVTPNLSFSSYAPAAGNNASSQIFIRGIGQTEFLPTTDPGVGLYIDDVYMARSVGATLDFVDLAQIEILRGPQGTLFGRNTIGGAINITTRKPGDEFSGKLAAKLGSDSRREVNLSIDMPLSESLATTVSLGARKRDGYVNRILTGEDLGNDDSMGGRFAADWDASENLNIYLTADYVKEDENGSPIVFNGLSNDNLFARLARFGAFVPGCNSLDPSLLGRCNTGDWDAGKNGTYSTYPVHSYFETWGSSLIARWETSWVTIKSISAYRDMEWSGSRDADNTPLTILHTTNEETQEQWSQEFQFSGLAMNDRLNWLFGLYYFEEEASDDYFVPVAVGTFNTGGLVENDSQAVFGQFTYDINDALALTLGGRWTEENKGFKPLQFVESPVYVFPIVAAEREGGADNGRYVHPFDGNTYTSVDTTGDGINNAAVTPLGTLFYPEEWRSESYTDTTLMMNLSWDINENVMGYVSYSEGFKSGGFNGRNIKPGPEVRTFKPELATTIEIGFKADLVDNTIRLNGALFTTDYEDLQFVIREDFAPIVFNAGAAEINGLELEWTWVPTSSIEVVGGLGYLDASYTELSSVLVDSGVLKENKMPHVPDLSANIGVAYSLSLASGGTLTPRIDWSYRDDVAFDSLNQPEIIQDSYDVINASVRWTSSDTNVEVVFSVNNLADEDYKLAGNSALRESSSYSEVVYARGREWALAATYHF